MLPIDNGVDILSFTLHESTLGWQNRLGEAPDQSHAKSAWPPTIYVIRYILLKMARRYTA